MIKNISKKAKETNSLFADELARTVLDSLSAHIAILDENGVILETNKAWRDFAEKSGMPENHDDRGSNYLAICEATIGNDADDAGKVAEGIRTVIGDQVEEYLHDYPCHSEDGPHWYYMRANGSKTDRRSPAKKPGRTYRAKAESRGNQYCNESTVEAARGR
jgi:PAS domain-containing protein